MFSDYKLGGFFTPKRFVNVGLISIQATIAGGSGAPTLDTANSSPNTTIARNAAGQYTVTFPRGQWIHPIGAETVLAEQLGSRGFFETLDAAGSATIEFGTTPGTAAEVADNTRLCIALLIGKA